MVMRTRGAMTRPDDEHCVRSSTHWAAQWILGIEDGVSRKRRESRKLIERLLACRTPRKLDMYPKAVASPPPSAFESHSVSAFKCLLNAFLAALHTPIPACSRSSGVVNKSTEVQQQEEAEEEERDAFLTSCEVAFESNGEISLNKALKASHSAVASKGSQPAGIKEPGELHVGAHFLLPSLSAPLVSSSLFPLLDSCTSLLSS